MPAAITRRSLLLGSVAVLALGACTGDEDDAGPDPSPSPSADPDEQLVAAALGRQLTLIAAYDATIVTHPTLSPRLTPFRARHIEHRDALERARSEEQSPSPTNGPVPTVDPDPGVATSGLARLEDAASAADLAVVPEATADLGRLLAAVAACEAAHGALLRSAS